MEQPQLVNKYNCNIGKVEQNHVCQIGSAIMAQWVDIKTIVEGNIKVTRELRMCRQDHRNQSK